MKEQHVVMTILKIPWLLNNWPTCYAMLSMGHFFSWEYLYLNPVFLRFPLPAYALSVTHTHTLVTLH